MLYIERVKIVVAKAKRPLEGHLISKPIACEAGKSEHSQRTGIGDGPQLGGSVVDVGVGGKRRNTLSSSATVMGFVDDAMGIGDRALLVGDVDGGHSGRDGVCDDDL